MSHNNSSNQFIALAANVLEGLGIGSQDHSRGRSVETRRGKVLFVSSTRAGEGKSYTTMGLAKELQAITGSKILLIDANVYDENDLYLNKFRREKGLSEMLSTRTDGSAIPTIKLDSGISLLTVGRTRDNKLLYHYEAIAKLIECCKADYDLVLIDGPSISQAPKNAFVAVADSIIWVVDSQSTRREAAVDALNMLGDAKRKIMGCVLNKKIYYTPDALYARL